MSFVVTWGPRPPEALDIAGAVADKPGRSAIESGLDEVQRLLRTDPLHHGESRTDDFDRVVAVLPLTAFHRVDVRLRAVRVYYARVHRSGV
ncbi:MAG: hypothetical protein ACRCT8_12670 [Lacipirellulaceae bacterium]